MKGIVVDFLSTDVSFKKSSSSQNLTTVIDRSSLIGVVSVERCKRFGLGLCRPAAARLI